MVNYILKLELNCCNKMIFAVQYKEKDIALIMFEDCCREGELLKDFSYLYPQYYASEDEWDDHRNLIIANIFVLAKEGEQEEIRDDLVYLAESMVEYKPSVNHKVQFCEDIKVGHYYAERRKHREQFIKYMLSLCENQETFQFDEGALNHLSQ